MAPVLRIGWRAEAEVVGTGSLRSDSVAAPKDMEGRCRSRAWQVPAGDAKDLKADPACKLGNGEEGGPTHDALRVLGVFGVQVNRTRGPGSVRSHSER